MSALSATGTNDSSDLTFFHEEEKQDITTTIMTTHGPIQIMEGAAELLSTDVGEDIKNLARKYIALPQPINMGDFEETRKELVRLAESDQDREVIEKVTRAILHITFPMLVAQLRSCIADFNRRIGDTEYEAVVVKGKSNEWMTQLALKYGIRPPKRLEYFAAADNDYLSGNFSRAETIVIIDDCSYSAGQSAGFIKAFTKLNVQFSEYYDEEGNLQSEIEYDKFPRLESLTVKNMYFLIPFISSIARRKIDAYTAFVKEYLGVNIEVITSSIPIPTAKDILSRDEFRCFCKLFKISFNAISLGIPDWRIPDYASMSVSLKEGKICYNPPVKTSSRLVPAAVFKPYGNSIKDEIEST